MVEVSRRVVKSERGVVLHSNFFVAEKKSFKVNVLIYNLISNDAKKK